MPFELKWDGRLLRITLSGKVTNTDLRTLTITLDEIEAEQPEVPHRLTDLRGMTELVGNHEIVHEAAMHRREKKFPNRFKTALIAGNALQLGYARMFQTLNDNPSITLRIFPDEPMALQWLSED